MHSVSHLYESIYLLSVCVYTGLQVLSDCAVPSNRKFLILYEELVSMRISVVVPTYNHPYLLRATVDSLLNQTIDNYEVIIVDDGSTDPKQQRVLEDVVKRRRIRVIEQENQGPATARNTGWRAAQSEVVAFTDDDCVVRHEWLERLLCAYNEFGVAGVGGPLSPPDDAIEANVFARYDWFKNEFLYNLPDEPVVDPHHVGGTANMSYRRSVLREVDGFDETYPIAAGEDADLKDRVEAAGYELAYVPVPVEHYKSYTLDAFVSQSVRRGRGEFHYLSKTNRKRSVLRILIGLVGTPISALSEAEPSYPAVSLLHVCHRLLSRWGELLEALDW